jgi:hypothetical protein
MNWSAVGVLLEVDEPAGGRRGTEVLLFLLAQRHAATDTVRTSLLGVQDRTVNGDMGEARDNNGRDRGRGRRTDRRSAL